MTPNVGEIYIMTPAAGVTNNRARLEEMEKGDWDSREIWLVQVAYQFAFSDSLSQFLFPLSDVHFPISITFFTSRCFARNVKAVIICKATGAANSDITCLCLRSTQVGVG